MLWGVEVVVPERIVSGAPGYPSSPMPSMSLLSMVGDGMMYGVSTADGPLVVARGAGALAATGSWSNPGARFLELRPPATVVNCWGLWCGRSAPMLCAELEESVATSESAPVSLAALGHPGATSSGLLRGRAILRGWGTRAACDLC